MTAKRIVGPALLVLFIGLVVCWVRSNSFLRKASRNIRSDAVVAEDRTTDKNALLISQSPTLFRVSGYPPTNAKEAELWDWYRLIEKENPNWQWERPIDFFGQVVDQFNQAISDATVTLQWAAGASTPQKVVSTNADGKFELRNAKGKRLTVRVHKTGYRSLIASTGTFEYAGFWENTFHVPDPVNPITFRLQKPGVAEPMYLWSLAKDLRTDGTAYRFDVNSGTFASSGDLEFTITRRNERGPREFDYTLTLQVPGGGIAFTDEELMFDAPADGYVSHWSGEYLFGAKDYSNVKKLQFYVKTATGTYAAVQAQVSQMRIPEAQVQMIVYYNPSGSRRLEYDSTKKINR